MHEINDSMMQMMTWLYHSMLRDDENCYGCTTGVEMERVMMNYLLCYMLMPWVCILRLGYLLA